MITLKVDVDGITRCCDILEEQVNNLDDALKAFSGYMRVRVQQRFASQGPNWPARSEATETAHHRVEQVHALAVSKLKKKLERELGRARVRREAGKGTEAAVERRYAVLKEFLRQVSGGVIGIQLGKDARREKSIAGLQERFQRAAERDHGLLGKMASSIGSKIKKGTLTMYSHVAWSGVHNDGGTAGHGAKIPARPFLFVNSEDLDVLSDIVLDKLGAAFR